MNLIIDALLMLDFPTHLQIVFACIVCMLGWMVAYHCVTSKYYDRTYAAIQNGNDRETVLAQVQSYPISASLKKELSELVNSHYLE